MKSRWMLGLALGVAITGAGRAENLLTNPGFESGRQNWSLFVPRGFEDKSPAFTISSDSPHSGACCAQITSTDFARYSLGPERSFSAHAGERFRLSFWIRAGAADYQPGKGAFAVRILPLQKQGRADLNGSEVLFVGLGGKVTVQSNADGIDLLNLQTPVPASWTFVQAVIELPADPAIDTVSLGWFGWFTKGSFFLDDLTFERVDAQTALSPIVAIAPPPASLHPGPVTTDDQIAGALNTDFPGMQDVKAALAHSDLTTAKSAYLAYRRMACPAKYFVMPGDQPAEVVSTTDPAGDRVCKHIVDNVFMGDDFDWHHNPLPRTSPDFTHEWTWGPISRTRFWAPLAHAYWATRNEKYAQEWVAELLDFATKNPVDARVPPGEASLWRTLDAAIRMHEFWPSAYYHFLNSPSFTPEAQWTYLRVVYDHAQLLVNGLKDPNRSGNWVSTECFGLYAIGVLFPELREASLWRETAMNRLTAEAKRMILPDGYEAELTPNYHYVTLGGYAGPLKLAQLNGLPVPPEFREKIRAMYRAPVMVMDQNGGCVPTNDSQIIKARPMSREGLEILGKDPLLLWSATDGRQGQQPPDSTMLPYAGFYAMRGGWNRNDMFLFFRGGPTGLAHQHEDMLEIVLRAWNKTLLFDPGTYSYDHSDWRRFAIGTASHNTIIVDGKWQHRGQSSVPMTEPLKNPWITSPLFDYVSATYSDGYQANMYDPKPQGSAQRYYGAYDRSVSHTRRILFLRPYYALVLDTLDGTGHHTFDAHFHLDALAARMDENTQAAYSQDVGSTQLALIPLDRNHLTTEIIQGQKEPLLGWMPVEHRPIPTVRFRKVQEAPATFATILFPYRGATPAFGATRLLEGGGSEGELWTQSIQTPYESADIFLRKSNTTGTIAAKSTQRGNLRAQAAALVIRRSITSDFVATGGWDLTSYQDGGIEFSLANPASPGMTLVWVQQGNETLMHNAGSIAAIVRVTVPFTLQATLPPGTWTRLSAAGAKSITTPELFKPSSSAGTAAPYADYLHHQNSSATAGTTTVRFGAHDLETPKGTIFRTKIGAAGDILSGWNSAGTAISMHVPAAGWYRIKVRYCAQADTTRTLLIDEKLPFAEAEAFTLESTQGPAPSDGWSNVTNDWKEIMLGADIDSDGWRIYLPQGKLSLRNDSGGGANIDWIELIPVTDMASQ